MVMFRVFVLSLFFISSALYAITPEELMRLSGKGAADKRRVEQQLNLDDLQFKIQIEAAKRQLEEKENKNKEDTLSVNQDEAIAPVDANKTKPETASRVTNKQPRSSKYSNRTDDKAPAYQSNYKPEHPQNIRNQQRNTELRRSGSKSQYTPATQTQPSNIRTVAYSDAILPDNKRYFGIRRGTWIKAELRRDVNNAEPGDVELYLAQEVHGKKHTLPVDTQLFADKAFNSATQRLDLITTYAITPSGREFVLKARIYDTFKISGLNGIIDADDSKIAERGATSSLAALGNGVLSEVGGGSVLGNALSKGGQSMIKDQQRASDLGTNNQITIYVAPQPLLLRVEETF